jgi:hypothetical protein
LHPSPRDLNQISSVLLVEMFRHIETLGRTIKVEVAFRFHVSPSGTCGLNLELEFGSTSTEASQVQRFKDDWPSWSARPSFGQKHRQPVDLAFGHEILGGNA